MPTIQDEFERLLDVEKVLGLETLMTLIADGDEWECIEHAGCQSV
jgi:hypothetical protein